MRPSHPFRRSTRRVNGLLWLIIVMVIVFVAFIFFARFASEEKKEGQQRCATNTSRSAFPYDFSIIVFTYARPDGLDVTLNSLRDADYSKAGGSPIDLLVFVDYRRKDSDTMRQKQSQTLDMLNNFSWPYGRFRLHRRCVNAGLRHSIMESWYPTSHREVVAFFEDDVEVSPFWFSWVYDALLHYAPIERDGIRTDPHFIGISLFRPIYDELSRKRIHINNDYAPFLFQQPCSWGAVYFPEAWRKFRDFFDEKKTADALVVLPDSQRNPSSNSWYFLSSWKKYLIYYMYYHGLYMLYPNYPEKLVLSTSHMLKGEHRTPPKADFVLPLVRKANLDDEQVERSLHRFPEMSEMKVYDMMFEEVKAVEVLPNYNN